MSDSSSHSEFEPNLVVPIPMKRAKEVCLDKSLLLKGISSVMWKKGDRDEADTRFPFVTHLHLQNKGIDILVYRIDKRLTTLYLYDNRIREIVGLDSCRQLETLYMQRNQLEKITGLQTCHRLRKLYLGQNDLQVVEGLDTLCNLEELHIEQQRLANGEQLVFDPLTLENLSTCLQILNVSSNGLRTLDDLAGMANLHTIICSHNRIRDLERTSVTLATLPALKVIDLKGNPVAKSPKYEEKIIGHSQTIDSLDGKTYSETTRQFMTRFCAMKARKLGRTLASINVTTSSGGLTTTTSNCDQVTESKSLIPSQLSNPIVQSTVDNDLGLNTASPGHYANTDRMGSEHAQKTEMKLLKPQEIQLPQFSLEDSQSFSRTSATSVKPGKAQIFKGLASQGFISKTKSYPEYQSTVGRRQAHEQVHATSLDKMMPSAQSISKLQKGNDTGSSGSHGDNVASTVTTVKEIPIPNTKVLEFPPWPHILKNLGKTTSPKVNFI